MSGNTCDECQGRRYGVNTIDLVDPKTGAAAKKYVCRRCFDAWAATNATCARCGRTQESLRALGGHWRWRGRKRYCYTSVRNCFIAERRENG